MTQAKFRRKIATDIWDISTNCFFLVVMALDVPNVSSNHTAKLSLGQQAEAPVNELLEAMMWLGRLAVVVDVVVELLMQFSDKVSIMSSVKSFIY